MAPDSQADGSDETNGAATARIAVTPETRDLVCAQKRGGETYDELLRKMVEQYTPAEDSGADNGGDDQPAPEAPV